MEEAHCCCIPDQENLDEGCPAPAKWIIVHGDLPDEYTHSCTEHIGELLTDAPEHRIYPLN